MGVQKMGQAIRTIYRSTADMEESATNYNKKDLIDSTVAGIIPLRIIEQFCKIATEGGTPRPWMMDALHKGFGKYLVFEGKKELAQCLGITAKQFTKTTDTDYQMMQSYAIIFLSFGLTHRRTAKIIKKLYPDAINSITQNFQRIWLSSFKDKISKEMSKAFLEELNITNEVIFKEINKYCQKTT